MSLNKEAKSTINEREREREDMYKLILMMLNCVLTSIYQLSCQWYSCSKHEYQNQITNYKSNYNDIHVVNMNIKIKLQITKLFQIIANVRLYTEILESLYSVNTFLWAQLAGVVEYANCISEDG